MFHITLTPDGLTVFRNKVEITPLVRAVLIEQHSDESPTLMLQYVGADYESKAPTERVVVDHAEIRIHA
jgi:hypothetical protein